MFRHNYFQHLFSNFQCIVHTLLFFTIIPLIDSRNARDYDGFLAPDSLKPLSWLLGVWRSEHDGKAMFPTIPKFTYGEEISISLTNPKLHAEPAFNYTAFAWSAHDRDELHSENGYITVYSGGTRVALTTVMNNGFVTVEEGPVSNFRIRFKLVDIGRISFSRDLPVHDLVREWSLIDGHHLEARLDMETRENADSPTNETEIDIKIKHRV
uniref:THAP4-like heme-binding beta-barrel domain-containing protein n=1 Tax=Meloidogyne javanica TaxID=6303 RepID=A0A915LZV7_MELJA